MLKDDFISLAIETYGCFHSHFDSFFISCIYANIAQHQQTSLVFSMLIFYYRKQMSITFQRVEASVIISQTSTLKHNFSSLPHILASAFPSLAQLWQRMAFQHQVFYFITIILIVLVFFLCVYNCFVMPCIFCGWISILVFIYI